MSEKMDLSHYTPHRLDDGAKFLSWEVDITMTGPIGVLVGIDSGFPVTGLFLGIGAVFSYEKLKVGKHPSMTTHLLYWLIGFPEPKELPGSHI